MYEKNFLSTIEYMVLDCVLRLNGKAYGVPIYEAICKATEKDNLAYGVIYKTLKSLKRKGFIKSSKREATPERGGRAKTYYQIEALGVKAIKDFDNGIQKLKLSLPQLYPLPI